MTKQRSDRKARKSSGKHPPKNEHATKGKDGASSELPTQDTKSIEESDSLEASPEPLNSNVSSGSSVASEGAFSEVKQADIQVPSTSSTTRRRSVISQVAKVAVEQSHGEFAHLSSKAPTSASIPPTRGAFPYDPMPQWVALKDIDTNPLFKLRSEGDVETLATSIVRSGQLSPIDLRPKPGSPGRFQIVNGFRRVAAMKLIMRQRIAATIHADLSDADALSLALTALLERKSASKGELEALKNRLEKESRLTPMANDMLTQAIVPEALTLSPETIDCAPPEPNPCELVDKILSQFGSLNQDLNQLAKCWDQIPREIRDVILQQLGYSSEMARYFRRLPGGLF